jgi:O-antigen ligase like membrane protein
MKYKGVSFRGIFVFLFSIIVIIDSLNGFIISKYNLPVSIGQIYRSLVFLIMVIILLKYSSRKIFYTFFIFFYFIIMQFIYFYNHSSINGLVLDITETFKPLLVIFSVEAYRSLYEKGIIGIKDLNLILKINLGLFPLSIIVPKILGLGSSVYSNGSGYKAFYNANNDLNIVLLVLLIFTLEMLLDNIKNVGRALTYGTIILLLLIVLLLIGSKSSMFFSTLILFIYLIRAMSKNSLVNNLKIIILISIVVYSLSNILMSFYRDEISLIIERQKYFYETQVIKGNDIVTFLLTGRNEFLIASLNAFLKESLLPIKIVFGLGKYEHSVLSGTEFGRDHLIIEMDFFDVLFSYGLLGTLILYGYFFTIFLSSLYKKESHFFFAYLSYVVIAIFSFLGGHVIFSALSGSFLALICCYLISYKKINGVCNKKSNKTSLT